MPQAKKLPVLRLERSEGLKFKTPQSALARWDKNIRAAKATGGEIAILGEIGDPMWGGISAGMVKEALAAIGNAPVLVTLNSPGGDAFEGIAIYNVLRAHSAKVTVNVIGLAASAASVVAMAGDTVNMGEGAFIMIHSAWGLAAGNQQQLREFADVLNAIDQSIAGLYASRTGLTAEECLALMQAETWLPAEEAVAKGFADSVTKDAKKSAKNQSTQVHAGLLAASGDRRAVVRLSATPPGASGQTPPLNQGRNMKTIAEQIAAFEAKRQTSVARMQAIMQKASEENRTLDAAETEEYDGLETEVGAVDAHIVRLKKQESLIVARATPVVAAVAGADPVAAAAAARHPNSGIVAVRANLEPGIKMARYALALLRSRGNLNDAKSIVENNRQWMDTSPELGRVMAAAVAAGDTTTAGWASELVYAENLANEFIEFLRPLTILGKLTDMRRVPFNVRMGTQTAGGTANWVGQGQPVPMSKLTTGSATLGITKAAGLIAIEDELVRSSSPSAELLVRNDLAATIAAFLDVSFIDPNQGGSANVQPASVTYGLTPVTPSGTNAAAIAADIASLFTAAIAANLNPVKGVWVMSATQALALSLMLTSLGQPQYPDISINGGTWFGLPVIVSQAANISGSPDYANMIALVIQNEILLADDGQVTIEISNEASIQMLDNPTNASNGGTVATTMVSMFQTNSMAIKAVRYINWLKRRSAAVAFIRTANYH